MSTENQIALKISGAQIEQFCSELCRGSSNISRTHSALTVLEGFIIRHASADSYTPDFNKIVAIIQHFSEQTRQDLLKLYASSLEPALLKRDIPELTRIHQALSRSGFDQLLGTILAQSTPQQRDELVLWSAQWCDAAEQRALAASGYPDALNFCGAGISPAEYSTINELRRKLQSSIYPSGEGCYD